MKRKVGLRESISHLSLDAHNAATVWPMTADALGRVVEIFKKLERPARVQRSSEKLAEDSSSMERMYNRN